MPVTPHSVTVALFHLAVPVYRDFRDVLWLPTSPEEGIHYNQAADSQA